jgi:hypothetical protein
MTSRINTCGTVVLSACAAIALAGVLATPAFADKDHDYQNKGWDHSHQEQAHQRAWQQQHWPEAHRYDGYYRQPNVYYTAPPVVYQPQGYYQQPGALLNFNFR